MIKDEKLKKLFNFYKNILELSKNKSSFRNESLHNRVYKLLVTNNCDNKLKWQFI
nr:hypothetical protein [Mycoplasmopsis bovis]